MAVQTGIDLPVLWLAYWSNATSFLCLVSCVETVVTVAEPNAPIIAFLRMFAFCACVISDNYVPAPWFA